METAKLQAIALLKELIAIPSFSREEKAKADFLEAYLTEQNCHVKRVENNLWCIAESFDTNRPTLLINSHIDTVKPSESWNVNPFLAHEDGEKIVGLGSNDAHASVVSLISVFLTLRNRPLPYNLVLALSAEEEVSGKNGMELLLQHLPKIDFAIVGEPTRMQAAIAEKGLMVLDCVAHGKSGHAARNEGVNAITLAMKDIEWFDTYRFEKRHSLLGDVKMSVTQINAGTQHNVIPDQCRFVVDIRSNGCYSNKELFSIIKQHVQATIEARSFRLNASDLPTTHAAYRFLQQQGIELTASSTLSDLALMPFPGIKLGVGDSARSHTADEYIEKNEIYDAIDLYYKLLCRWQF